MLSSLNTTQKGILYALSGFTAFSIADACAKWLGDYYNTGYIMFWTYCVALWFGVIFSPFLGGLVPTFRTNKIFVHIARGIFALGVAFMAISAMKGLSLAMLYTILFLAPFLTTVAAWPLYKEPVSLRNWLIIAFGFSGIVIAFRPDVTGVSIEIVFAFLALFFIVGLSLLARPLKHNETVLSLSFYPSVVIIAVLGVSFWPELRLPAQEHVPVFILNGFSAAIGLSGINSGFRMAPYAMIAPLHYVQMIIAIVLGYFIFNDIPDLWVMTGAAIIIVSGIMLAFSSHNTRDAS